MVKVLVPVFLFLSLSQGIAASKVSLIEIPGYRNGVSFSGINRVLIKRGDNPAFRELSCNDSDWRVISLPSNWNDYYPGYNGVCWYRIHFHFPAGLPENSLGIRLGVIKDADETYFNGRLIGRSGSIMLTEKSAYDRKRLYEIPSRLIRPNEDNVLAIRVRGLFHDINGPYRGDFEIGFFQRMQSNFLLREFLDIAFVVVYLVVTFYFGLYFLRLPSYKDFLFFSIFCLSMSIYFLMKTQIKFFLFDDFLTFKRIEYIALILGVLSFFEFITFHFDRRHTLFHYIFYWLSVIGIVLISATGDFRFWHKVLFYSIQPSWLIPVIFFAYVMVKEFSHGKDAKYILSGFMLLFICVINDLLVHRAVYDFIRISQYGFLFVTLSITLIMRERFADLEYQLAGMRIQKVKKERITSYSREKVEEAVDLITDGYSTDITREEIAADLGLNPDHLGKIFKKQIGKTINDYINELRVREAVEKLVSTEHTIIDIAYSVGFESMSTFYRVFQKVMGKSPSKYREDNTAENSGG